MGEQTQQPKRKPRVTCFNLRLHRRGQAPAHFVRAYCEKIITERNRWWTRLPDTEQLMPICATCWSRGNSASYETRGVPCYEPTPSRGTK